MKWIRSLIFVLLLALLLPTFSCTRQEAMPWELVESLLSEAEEVPSGVLYRSDAEEGSEAYASPALLRSLYGEGAEERFTAVEAYAIYLASFATPCEIAVFSCYSSTDANRLETLCLRRAEEVRVALRGTPYEAVSAELRVWAKGRMVFFLLCEDAERLGREILQ